MSRHAFTAEERRRGGLANPFTSEEAARGRSIGRRSMVTSGVLAQRGARGRVVMRQRREAMEVALDLFDDLLGGALADLAD
jgi:hypothetical protein